MSKIMVMIMLLTIMAACNKNNNNPVVAESGLAGIWVLTNISGSTLQGSITISPGLAGISMTLVLNGDNTAILSMVQQGQATTESYTWISINSTIVLYPQNGGTAIILPYTRTGNKINAGFVSILPFINFNGVQITSLIMEFTKQ